MHDERWRWPDWVIATSTIAIVLIGLAAITGGHLR